MEASQQLTQWHTIRPARLEDLMKRQQEGKAVTTGEIISYYSKGVTIGFLLSYNGANHNLHCYMQVRESKSNRTVYEELERMKNIRETITVGGLYNNSIKALKVEYLKTSALEKLF